MPRAFQPHGVAPLGYVETMARVPINREMLRWALEDVGIDVGGLQTIVEKPLTEIQSWVDGDQVPHLGDLRKIAKATGRSPYFFLRSAPPTAAVASVSRRTAMGVPVDATPDERKAVQTADQIRVLASWLAEVEGRKKVDWPSLNRSSAPSAGKALRSWLNIDVKKDQTDRSSKTAIYARLRQLSEQQGIIVLQIAFGKDAPQGFSLPDELAPTIVINSSYELRSVRSYTLMHELCHLAAHSPSFSHEDNASFERWAESASAAALIPEEDVRHYLKTYRKLDKVAADDLDTIRLLSRRFGASWVATAIRLEELKLAQPGLVAAVTDNEPRESGFVPGGQNRAERRLQEFGSTFPNLLLEGIDEGKLSSLDVRRYLRLETSAEMLAVRSLAAVGS